MQPDPQPNVEPLTADAWLRVKQLFDGALALPPDEREAFLHERASSDTERDEVTSLLAAHEQARSFLTTGPGDTARGWSTKDDARLPAGARIGPYEVLGLLGEGGMGVVYRARRDGLARDVALKVLRAGLVSARLAERFRVETSVLARLEHASIARLLDAGTSADGQPFVVMELVLGQPIDRHCAAARLGLRARLELFHKLCLAVAYAHQRLVVHRDIKPGNVLVTRAGEPKLLDFGLAKLQGAEAGEALTLTGLCAMTPEYASPEQVRGQAITAATDVHALGLLLHLLLTGQPALRLTTLTPEALLRAVCLDEPPRPSLVVRGLTSEQACDLPDSRVRLERLLRGDLDTIVGKALRKEPERRYGSVEQLAEDVRRYLAGLPVLARGDTWRYRAGKFVRRNRLSVGLAVACALALLGGMAATTWQARVARAERARALRRFVEVRQLATSLLFEVHEAVKDLPGSTQARGLIVNQAVEHLGRLAAEADRDPGLQRELGLAYVQLAQVVGAIGGANLGDRRAAYGYLERAIELLSRSHTALAEPHLAGELADAHTRLAQALIGQVRHDEALQHLAQARLLAQGASASLGRVEDVLREVNIEELGANLLADRSAWKDVIARLSAAQARLQTLGERPGEPDVRRRRLAVTVRLGEAFLNAGRPEEARQVLTTALADLQAGDAVAGNAERRLHGIAESMLAQASSELGDAREAAGHAQQARGIFEQMRRADPANFQARLDLTNARANQCAALLEARGPAEAREACRATTQLAEELRRERPDDPSVSWVLGYALDHDARLARAERRYADAQATYRRMLGILGEPRDPLRRRAAASVHVAAAQTAREQGRPAEAAAHARSGLVLLEQARGEAPHEPSVLFDLGSAQTLLARIVEGQPPGTGDAREAASLRRSARETYEGLRRLGATSPALTRELRQLASDEAAAVAPAR